MSVEPTPSAEQLRDLIRGEDEALQRVVGFIEQGVRARRIARSNGDALIAAALRAHDAKVQALCSLLGKLEGGQE